MHDIDGISAICLVSQIQLHICIMPFTQKLKKSKNIFNIFEGAFLSIIVDDVFEG